MATWDETPEEREKREAAEKRVADELKKAAEEVQTDPDALKKIREKTRRRDGNGKHRKARGDRNGKHRK